MATFKSKVTAPKPPAPEEAPELAERAETVEVVARKPEPSQEPVKRGKGRPPSSEPRVVFGTRLKAETITDVEAIKAGLRLKMQGEAIERAVEHYKRFIIEKTRRELHLAPQVDDEAVLLKAFKVDD